VTEQYLKRECRKRLPGFMVPQFYETVPALPRTDPGRIKIAGPAGEIAPE
jgi:hypothetical protein